VGDRRPDRRGGRPDGSARRPDSARNRIASHPIDQLSPAPGRGPGVGPAAGQSWGSPPRCSPGAWHLTRLGTSAVHTKDLTVVHRSTGEAAGLCTRLRTARMSILPCTRHYFPRSHVHTTSETDTALTPGGDR
jgi:hypothetical protein